MFKSILLTLNVRTHSLITLFGTFQQLELGTTHRDCRFHNLQTCHSTQLQPPTETKLQMPNHGFAGSWFGDPQQVGVAYQNPASAVDMVNAFGTSRVIFVELPAPKCPTCISICKRSRIYFKLAVVMQDSKSCPSCPPVHLRMRNSAGRCHP